MACDRPVNVLPGLMDPGVCLRARECLSQQMQVVEQIALELRQPTAHELRTGVRARAFSRQYDKMMECFATYVKVGCACEAKHLYLDPRVPGTLAYRRFCIEMQLLGLYGHPRYDRQCRDIYYAEIPQNLPLP